MSKRAENQDVHQPSQSAAQSQPASPEPALQPEPAPQQQQPQPACPEGEPILLEVAWEVCQQVGGIYTVIRSKAPSIVSHWGERYCLIGPYNGEASANEFEEGQPECVFLQIMETLRQWGLRAYYGTWLITGRPQVILLDLSSAVHRLSEIKYLLWEHHRVPSPTSDSLLDQVLTFGYMVEQVMVAAVNSPEHPPVVAHFHEWMGGTSIPELRRRELPVSIVFTTHATLQGRYLAASDPWFYDHVPFVDWQADAKRYNIETQVLLERAAAHGAHVFTTLSDITNFECEHLLGRRSDLLLPNGLNIERFTAMHEFQNLHRQYKDKINQFVMAHFFPSYTFDLDKTVFFFTSGRYEYRNKGFDMTIDSLARLNRKMKEIRSDRTVVFFLVTQRPYRSINSEVLHRRALMEEIRGTCDGMKEQFGDRLFQAAARGRTPDFNELVDDTWRLRLRRVQHAWKSRRLPTIVTHDIVDDVRDEVLNQLRFLGLINSPHDPVKVIYHPDFISFSDPLFGMDYDQFVRGCHLGVFPSAYEPWGYTPEECVARGVPAITSDLSGFGTYLAENVPDYRKRGLFVVHRRHQGFEQASEEMAEWMLEFTRMERRDRIAHRNQVESLSDQFDWGNLICYYMLAYEMARKRTGV